MKVEANQKVKQYLNKCIKNIQLSQLDELVQLKFDGCIMNKEIENQIKKLYNAYGVNYTGCKYMRNILLDNPYFSNIKLSDINSGKFKYENKVLEKGRYVVVDELRPIDKYFRECAEMRCLSQSISYPILTEVKGKNEDVWMSITPAEINSHKQPIKNANGNCLVFGLGLGYYQYMISLKKSVKSITVIEKNIDVINLFKDNILPQFGELADKINIIHGDLYDYWNEEYLNSFDHIYVDVWKGPKDGFEVVEKICKQYNPKNIKVDFWLEYTIYQFLRIGVLFYFKGLQDGISMKLKMNQTGILGYAYNKAESFFNSINDVISTEKELIKYLSDFQTYRDILAYDDK